MFNAPGFWYAQRTAKDRVLAKILTPLGTAYGWLAQKRFEMHAPAPMARPVICIGNLVAGGAGKTPTAMALCDMLRDKGYNPHFLSRGYGGTEDGPTQVSLSRDTARDVGDEPLLLAEKAPAWVSHNRAQGAQAAIDTGASIIIMDDGFQNPSLHKDFSLLVFDGGAGFGNKKIFPAGPLREPAGFGLARADAAVIIGADTTGAENEIHRHRPDIPLLKAHLAPDPGNPDIFGKKVFAFAGIGRPDKFRDSLAAAGAVLEGWSAFPDHFAYIEQDLAELMRDAEAQNAMIITTAKDHVRLPEKLKDKVQVFRVHLVWEDAQAISRLLDAALGGNS